MPELKRLLITGCGRSGTRHTARVLREAGIDCPHEHQGEYGTVCWYCGVNGGDVPSAGKTGAYKIAGHRQGTERVGDFEYEHVALQVRDPLKVVASVLTSFRAVDWIYINRAVPDIGPPGPGWPARDKATMNMRFRRAMLYWHHWNETIEKRADHVYRVEAQAEAWPKLLKMLGLDWRPMPEVPPGTNANRGFRTPPTVTWDLLQQVDVSLARRMQDQARRYGYEVTT